jgi:hypothetical protein
MESDVLYNCSMHGPCKTCHEYDHLVPIERDWFCDTCYGRIRYLPRSEIKRPPLAKWYKRLRKTLFIGCPICLLCGGKIAKYNQASLDHIIPISGAGEHHPSNLQLTHKSCNQDKGFLYPLDYFLKIQLIEKVEGRIFLLVK